MIRALAVTLVVAAATSSQAFQRETTDDPSCVEAPGINCPHLGTPLFWDRSEVPFQVNPSASGLGSSAVLTAVEASFESWEAASGDAIRFTLSGTTSGGTDGNDGQNVVSWTPLDGDSFARSILTFEVASGKIVDVDIEMNSDFDWAVLPSGQEDPFDPRVDVQSVATHEAGHFLGLDHENRFGPDVVMYFSDTSGSTSHRTLKSDDREGVQAIYPGGGSSNGGGGGGGGGSGGCDVSASDGPLGGVELGWIAALALWMLGMRRQAPGVAASERSSQTSTAFSRRASRARSTRRGSR